MNTKTLVIGCSYGRSFLTLGALVHIEDILINKHSSLISQYFDQFNGSGTGAVIAFLLSIGYSAKRLIAEFSSIDKFNESFLDVQYSLQDINIITEIITKLIKEKFGCIPNMFNLYKATGKLLCFPLIERCTGDLKILDYMSHSKQSCLDCVLACIDVPSPTSLFTDGSFLRPYMLNCENPSSRNKSKHCLQNDTNRTILVGISIIPPLSMTLTRNNLCGEILINEEDKNIIDEDKNVLGMLIRSTVAHTSLLKEVDAQENYRDTYEIHYHKTRTCCFNCNIHITLRALSYVEDMLDKAIDVVSGVKQCSSYCFCQLNN